MLDKIIPEIMKVKIEDVRKMEFTKGKFWVYTSDGEVHSVPIKDVAKYARNPCHHCCDYTSVFADISVGSVGAPDGWNSVFIRTDAGEEYFDMVRKEMEIMIRQFYIFLIRQFYTFREKDPTTYFQLRDV